MGIGGDRSSTASNMHENSINSERTSVTSVTLNGSMNFSERGNYWSSNSSHHATTSSGNHHHSPRKSEVPGGGTTAQLFHHLQHQNDHLSSYGNNHSTNKGPQPTASQRNIRHSMARRSVNSRKSLRDVNSQIAPLTMLNINKLLGVGTTNATASNALGTNINKSSSKNAPAVVVNSAESISDEPQSSRQSAAESELLAFGLISSGVGGTTTTTHEGGSAAATTTSAPPPAPPPAIDHYEPEVQTLNLQPRRNSVMMTQKRNSISDLGAILETKVLTEAAAEDDGSCSGGSATANGSTSGGFSAQRRKTLSARRKSEYNALALLPEDIEELSFDDDEEGTATSPGSRILGGNSTTANDLRNNRNSRRITLGVNGFMSSPSQNQQRFSILATSANSTASGNNTSGSSNLGNKSGAAPAAFDMHLAHGRVGGQHEGGADGDEAYLGETPGAGQSSLKAPRNTTTFGTSRNSIFTGGSAVNPRASFRLNVPSSLLIPNQPVQKSNSCRGSVVREQFLVPSFPRSTARNSIMGPISALQASMNPVAQQLATTREHHDEAASAAGSMSLQNFGLQSHGTSSTYQAFSHTASQYNPYGKNSSHTSSSKLESERAAQSLSHQLRLLMSNTATSGKVYYKNKEFTWNCSNGLTNGANFQKMIKMPMNLMKSASNSSLNSASASQLLAQQESCVNRGPGGLQFLVGDRFANGQFDKEEDEEDEEEERRELLIEFMEEILHPGCAPAGNSNSDGTMELEINNKQLRKLERKVKAKWKREDLHAHNEREIDHEENDSDSDGASDSEMKYSPGTSVGSGSRKGVSKGKRLQLSPKEREERLNQLVRGNYKKESFLSEFATKITLSKPMIEELLLSQKDLVSLSPTNRGDKMTLASTLLETNNSPRGGNMSTGTRGLKNISPTSLEKHYRRKKVYDEGKNKEVVSPRLWKSVAL
ncbi:unnamed protein product [Amoebophrya sp. A120]|nr:unnamed protein product [Amoebophrya sp. A120]|eukprot:GSA120T00014204001.1